MAIEKLDFETIVREKIGYTIILTEIIQHIKDANAYMVWSYLYSHSANWKIIKNELKTKFKLGNTKLKRIFSYLNRCGLISYFQQNTGKFSDFSIHILCGNKFNKDEPFLVKNSGGSISEPTENSGGSISERTGNRSTGSGPLLKEINNKKKKVNENKDKSFCDSKNFRMQNKKRHRWADMKNEASAIEKNATYKRAAMPDSLKNLIVGLKKDVLCKK